MADEDRNEFYALADEFVRLANSLNAKWPPSRISAAMLYAAARYNAFNSLNRATELEQDKKQALEYLCEQYKEMLLENFDTIRKNKP